MKNWGALGPAPWDGTWLTPYKHATVQVSYHADLISDGQKALAYVGLCSPPDKIGWVPRVPPFNIGG